MSKIQNASIEPVGKGPRRRGTIGISRERGRLNYIHLSSSPEPLFLPSPSPSPHPALVLLLLTRIWVPFLPLSFAIPWSVAVGFTLIARAMGTSRTFRLILGIGSPGAPGLP